MRRRSPALAATGAALTDIDTALETCAVMVVLVDHDIFRSVPLDERRGKTVPTREGYGLTSPDLPPMPCIAWDVAED